MLKFSSLGALAILGCALSTPRAPAVIGALEPISPPLPEGVPLAHEESLRASLRGPSRTVYAVDALGISERSVAIRLVNTGARSADLGRLRVTFRAVREGVSFPCNQRGEGPTPHREPTSLAPGQSFAFERDIDCTMPLPGRYDLGVYVALKDAPESDFVGGFSLDVTAGSQAPRPYPSRPGLYLVMTASGETRPLPSDAWARGDYHVVVAAVNGSNRPVHVGRARLAFLTYKKGSPLPCSGQAEHVSFPEELAPGRLHVVRAPVTCAPSEEGRYEIVGNLKLDDSPEEIEIGRVAVKVTRDPLLFAPELWPSLGPRGEWTR